MILTRRQSTSDACGLSEPGSVRRDAQYGYMHKLQVVGAGCEEKFLTRRGLFSYEMSALIMIKLCESALFEERSYLCAVEVGTAVRPRIGLNGELDELRRETTLCAASGPGDYSSCCACLCYRHSGSRGGDRGRTVARTRGKQQVNKVSTPTGSSRDRGIEPKQRHNRLKALFRMSDYHAPVAARAVMAYVGMG